MLQIKVSEGFREQAVERLAQRFLPTRYEEPNRVEAQRVAVAEARRVWNEVERLIRVGRLVAPATVEV